MFDPRDGAGELHPAGVLEDAFQTRHGTCTASVPVGMLPPKITSPRPPIEATLSPYAASRWRALGEQRQVERLEQRDDERVGIAIEDRRDRRGLLRMEMRAAREHERTALGRDRFEFARADSASRSASGSSAASSVSSAGASRSQQSLDTAERDRDRRERIGMRDAAQQRHRAPARSRDRHSGCGGNASSGIGGVPRPAAAASRARGFLQTFAGADRPRSTAARSLRRLAAASSTIVAEHQKIRAGRERIDRVRRRAARRDRAHLQTIGDQRPRNPSSSRSSVGRDARARASRDNRASNARTTHVRAHHRRRLARRPPRTARDRARAASPRLHRSTGSASCESTASRRGRESVCSTAVIPPSLQPAAERRAERRDPLRIGAERARSDHRVARIERRDRAPERNPACIRRAADRTPSVRPRAARKLEVVRRAERHHRAASARRPRAIARRAPPS